MIFYEIKDYKNVEFQCSSFRCLLLKKEKQKKVGKRKERKKESKED